MGQPEGEEHRVEAARRPPGEHIRLDELHRQVIGAPAGQGQHLGGGVDCGHRAGAGGQQPGPWPLPARFPVTCSAMDPKDIVRRGYDALSHRYRGDAEEPAPYATWLAGLRERVRPAEPSWTWAAAVGCRWPATWPPAPMGLPAST
jgi:hypothetical protein